jgi:alkylhydroperoxidase/carboxymuconolactone decarboxylase family protein YurZ
MTDAMTVRREVLGDEYVDRAVSRTDPFTLELQPFITEYCWGQIWTDDRLPRRERSLLVLAMTAALGRMAEFEAHAAGALRNGVTVDELGAVLRQITVYCGVPAGVNAAAALRAMLEKTNGGTDLGPVGP